MSSGSSLRRATTQWPTRHPSSRLRICNSFLLSPSLRHSTTAATQPPSPSPPLPPQSSSPAPSSPHSTSADPNPSPQDTFFAVHASTILSRPPFLTRTPTPFELSYHLYQKRLNERFALPFTRRLFFARGKPQWAFWTQQMRRRLTPARDIGAYGAYDAYAWNDEVRLGRGAGSGAAAWGDGGVGDPERVAREALVEADMLRRVRMEEMGTAERGKGQVEGEAEGEAEGEGEGEGEGGKEAGIKVGGFGGVRPRVGEADRVGDTKSLDRAGERTLYLVVNVGGAEGGRERWEFPGGRVGEKDSLRSAAERTLHASLGPNMQTWYVGHAPVGVLEAAHPRHKRQPPHHDPATAGPPPVAGSMTFFMRARIMAGQASIPDGAEDGAAERHVGVRDFQWLTSDEVKGVVSAQYWSAVKDCLGGR